MDERQLYNNLSRIQLDETDQKSNNQDDKFRNHAQKANLMKSLFKVEDTAPLSGMVSYADTKSKIKEKYNCVMKKTMSQDFINRIHNTHGRYEALQPNKPPSAVKSENIYTGVSRSSIIINYAHDSKNQKRVPSSNEKSFLTPFDPDISLFRKTYPCIMKTKPHHAPKKIKPKKSHGHLFGSIDPITEKDSYSLNPTLTLQSS